MSYYMPSWQVPPSNTHSSSPPEEKATPPSNELCKLTSKYNKNEECFGMFPFNNTYEKKMANKGGYDVTKEPDGKKATHTYEYEETEENDVNFTFKPITLGGRRRPSKPSQKRPTARRRRSSKARKARKARATRRR